MPLQRSSKDQGPSYRTGRTNRSLHPRPDSSLSHPITLRLIDFHTATVLTSCHVPVLRRTYKRHHTENDCRLSPCFLPKSGFLPCFLPNSGCFPCFLPPIYAVHHNASRSHTGRQIGRLFAAKIHFVVVVFPILILSSEIASNMLAKQS